MLKPVGDIRLGNTHCDIYNKAVYLLVFSIVIKFYVYYFINYPLYASAAD